MIRVLLVGIYRGPGAIGGVVNYNNLLLKYIDRELYDLQYFSMGKSPNWYSGPDKPSLVAYYLGHIGKLFTFARMIRRSHTDIVHLQSTLSRTDLARNGIFSIVARILGARTIFQIAGWKDWEFEKIKGSRGLSFGIKRLLNVQDRIVVLSPSFKERLKGFSVKSNVSTTTTMMEAGNFSTGAREFSPPFQILFCGSLLKKKGVFELVRAIQIVKRSGSEVRLTLMGAGNELVSLTALAEELGVVDEIEFIGRKEGIEKRKVFVDSDVFILPSYTEGFPTVYCEALAAGLPYIGTQVGGLVHEFDHGKQGLVIRSNPPDPQEIANLILQMTGDRKMMKLMSENNSKEAKEKYDAKVVSAEMGVFYNEIMANGFEPEKNGQKNIHGS